MGVLPSINLHCENISHCGVPPMGKSCISMRGLWNLYSLPLFFSHRVFPESFACNTPQQFCRFLQGVCVWGVCGCVFAIKESDLQICNGLAAAGTLMVLCESGFYNIDIYKQK